jgi:hypothetical protein
LDCNVPERARMMTEEEERSRIASLIRKNKHKGADRGKKDALPQASPCFFFCETRAAGWVREQQDGCLPLHCAAQNGHATVTEQLIAARCNVNHQQKNGGTPVYFAAGNGYETVTEQLIAARCNVDLQEDKYGNTALHIASLNGYDAVTKLLIASRCNVDLQANKGATALQVAERHGHTRIASLIRKNKHKSADRGKKDALPQASPQEIKKRQEDADRAMKELLEEEDKDAAAAAAVSQKKKQAKKAGKERLAEEKAGEKGGQRAEERRDALPTDKTGTKRRSAPRSRRTWRGQRQRLFLRRKRLRI